MHRSFYTKTVQRRNKKEIIQQDTDKGRCGRHPSPAAVQRQHENPKQIDNDRVLAQETAALQQQSKRGSPAKGYCRFQQVRRQLFPGKALLFPLRFPAVIPFRLIGVFRSLLYPG